ncbi:hypothetical protein J6590_051114, partial [Homalodisca vitripennis]
KFILNSFVDETTKGKGSTYGDVRTSDDLHFTKVDNQFLANKTKVVLEYTVTEAGSTPKPTLKNVVVLENKEPYRRRSWNTINFWIRKHPSAWQEAGHTIVLPYIANKLR